MIVNPPKFILALHNNIPIVCKRDGTWYRESKVKLAIDWLLGRENRAIINTAHVALQSLYLVEQEKVCFTKELKSKVQHFDFLTWIRLSEVVENSLINIDRTNEVMQLRNQLSLSQLAIKYRLGCNNGGMIPLDEKAIDPRKYQELENVAKNWKLNQHHLNNQQLTEFDKSSLKTLCRYPEFLEFFLNLRGNKKDITDFHDFVFNWIIRDFCPPEVLLKFPRYVSRIKDCYLAMRLENEKHTKQILNTQFVIKDSEAVLDLTLNCFDKEKKIVEVSILNDKASIDWPGNRTITVKEIFDAFRGKNAAIQDLEVLTQYGPDKKAGVALYNCHTGGYEDSKGEFHPLVDFTKDNYYLEIPITETLTLEETQKKYEKPFVWDEWFSDIKLRLTGIPKQQKLTWVQYFSQYIVSTSRENLVHKHEWLEWLETKKATSLDWDSLINEASTTFQNCQELLFLLKESKVWYAKVDGKNWIMMGCANRRDLTGHYTTGAHGWVKYGIPLPDGSYEFRESGKLGVPFPVGPWEEIKFFCNSSEAVIESPDTNHMTHNRQFTTFSELVAEPKMIKNGLERIRQETVHAQEGKLAFQYQSEGCAGFSRYHLNKLREELGIRPIRAFYRSNKKVHPQGLMRIITDAIRPFPDVVMHFFFLFFRPDRSRLAMVDGKMKEVSYMNSQAWKDNSHEGPGNLHNRQIHELKRIKGGFSPRHPIGLLPKMQTDWLKKALA